MGAGVSISCFNGSLSKIISNWYHISSVNLKGLGAARKMDLDLWGLLAFHS